MHSISDFPLVTIYIPTYNRSDLLSRAINSVLTQSYQNIELLVIDDCSTDDTVEVVNSFIERDKRIQLIENVKNSGACFSRNKAIQQASGQFVTGLDDDDIFYPDRILNFVKHWILLNSMEVKVKALYSNSFLKNVKSNKKGDSNSKCKYLKLSRPERFRGVDLLKYNGIGNQVFTTKQYFLESLFDEDLPMWQDWDCWFRLLKKDYAYNTGSYDYLIDISHPHERITTKGIEKAKLAYDRVIYKYSFSRVYRARLFNSLYAYMAVPESHIKLLNMIMQQRSIYHSFRLIKIHVGKYIRYAKLKFNNRHYT